MAKSRHTRQKRLTQRQDLAVQVADTLITEWWSDPIEGIPLNRSGDIAFEPTMHWSTQIVPNHDLEAIGTQVLRVAVYDSDDVKGLSPLVTVDLVLPNPNTDDTKETSDD